MYIQFLSLVLFYWRSLGSIQKLKLKSGHSKDFLTYLADRSTDAIYETDGGKLPMHPVVIIIDRSSDYFSDIKKIMLRSGKCNYEGFFVLLPKHGL